ncbi:MAG: TetR/AcrR family transcriptional regulator [Clostridiaceae bacterium]|nr:TetR/AcrR family transcriptional regulator [Clostridiaceae bacterium]
MPRFSKNEKEFIRNKLLKEGERLFATHGIKKVTIDDLVEAVGIAKASFYKFYESKEYLYLDIVQGIQKKIFTELESILDSNVDLPGRERVRQTFSAMFKMMLCYPILAQIDMSTVKLIARKVSKERLSVLEGQNIDAVRALHNHGINFSCDIKTASYVFQALYHCWIYLQDKNIDVQTSVIDILFSGVINQIVAD